MNSTGQLAYREDHETKQEAYTLMLGCYIMLGRMVRELGDTWGQ